jgi:predicted nucleic acid-binding Zn ribbon protein
METITFFSAGRIFAERMFRYAGWSRIFGLIAGGGLVVVASVYGFLYYLSSLASGSGGGPSTLAFVQYTTSPGSFLRLFSLAVAGVYVILTIPDAFAFLGFNNMKKEPEYQVRPTQDAPIAMPQATSARFCPNCGKDVPVNAKSCSSCGWWFCPGCGSAISEGSRFCSVCGRMLL